MNEEQIIDKVSMIDQWKVSGDSYTQGELDAIGQLLELYYENKKQLEQEKEKNKEYEKQLDLDYVDKNYISKDKIKEIVDENIPKQPNIITGEMEYTPNTNANSFLVQDILKLLEEK